MGWRDRDWAKFDDDEWDAFVAVPALAPAGRSPRSLTITLIAALVTLGATAAALAVHFGASSPSSAPPAAPASQSSVTVRWSPTDLSLATTGGQVCVTDAIHGRICADYNAGERPADALTRQLENDGLTVRND